MGRKSRIIALLSAGLIGFGAMVTGSVAVTGSFDTSCVYAADIASGTYDGIDWRITQDGVLELGKPGETQTMTNSTKRTSWAWGDNRNDIISVRCVGNIIAQGSLHSMFYNCQNLSDVDLEGFDTSNVTNMRQMFNNCYKLTSLDLSGFDTTNVTDMGLMFYACVALENVNVSSFDTSEVTDMRFMFAGCPLKSLDVSNFNTSKVIYMNYMFHGIQVQNLDISNFDTGRVVTMMNMFYRCSNLETLNLGENFNMSSVEQCNSMFYECEKLNYIDVIPAIKYPPEFDGNVFSNSFLMDLYKSSTGSGIYYNTVGKFAIYVAKLITDASYSTPYHWTTDSSGNEIIVINKLDKSYKGDADEAAAKINEIMRVWPTGNNRLTNENFATIQRNLIFLKNNLRGNDITPTLYKRLLQNNTDATPDMTFSFSFEQQSQWDGVQYVSAATPIGDKSVTITQNSERLTQDEYVGNLTDKKLYQEKVDNVLSDFTPTVAGTYCYLVKENVPSPGLADVTYTGSQFIMKVEVDSNLEVTNVTNILYKDSDGKTRADYSTVPAIFDEKHELIFYNTYGTTGGTTPTGIITNITPFIIVGGGGVAGLVAYVVINAKRKAKQDAG